MAMDIDEYLNSDFSCEVEYYQGKPKIVILRNGKRSPILPWRRTLGFMASRALVLREPQTAQIMQRFCDSHGSSPLKIQRFRSMQDMPKRQKIDRIRVNLCCMFQESAHLKARVPA